MAATLVVAASDSKDSSRADYHCDGTADEVEINAALNVLPTAGGSVQLLEGTYTIAAQIIISANTISLIGSGSGTVIQTTSNIIMINVGAYENVLLSKIRLYGSSAGIAQTGIVFTGTEYSIVDKCWFDNMGANGIRFATNVLHCTINDCFATNCDGYAIYLGTANSTRHCIVKGCQVYDNNNVGILSIGWYSIITGNTASGNGSGGIHCFSNTSITGNICTGNDSNGIHIQGSNNLVDGNYSYDNEHGIFLSPGPVNVDNCVITSNISYDNTGNGIHVGSESDTNVISCNRCNANGNLGIHITAASCISNVIVSNVLTGNTGGALTDSGTGTEVAHNIVA